MKSGKSIFQNIALAIPTFIVGAYGSFFLYDYIKDLIKWAYTHFTDGNIYFVVSGKFEFPLFPSGSYHIAFGLFLLLVVFFIVNEGTEKAIKPILQSLTLALFGILAQSMLDAKFKLIECTMCDDGTRGIDFTQVPFDRIVISSLILGAVPMAWRLISGVLSGRRVKSEEV